MIDHRGDIVDSLISIIIPVYKVESYLVKCVESVMNQSYRNLEIILVDDGSPDNCGEICDQFASIDNRIKVIHKENGGLSSARNAGLKIATGDFIGFVDSDDWIEKCMYEYLVAKAIQEDADIVQCGFQAVFPNGKIERQYLFEDERYTTNQAILDAYFSQTKINVVVWNKLYKRDLIKDIRMVEGRLNEDTMFSLEVMLQSNKVVSIGKVYYNYLLRDTSIMKTAFTPKKMDAIFAQNHVTQLCENYAPKYVNHSHILSCLICFYLFNDLKNSSGNKYSLYEEKILEEFNNHFNVIKSCKEFKYSRFNSKFLIRGFSYSRWFTIRVFRIYNKLRFGI
jgi:glycosyltransferase involved in cell wall biosynthesis